MAIQLGTQNTQDIQGTRGTNIQGSHEVEAQPGSVGAYTTPAPASTQPLRQAHETQGYRGSVMFPLLLVGLGVLFLLNNIGMVSWDVWSSIWQLWPLLLVAAGIDLMIGRRSTAASVLTTVAIFGMLALAATGIWFWRAQQGAWPSNWTEQTQQIAQPLNGATQADVNIGFGAGTLRLSTLSDSSDLIRGTVELRGGEATDTTFRVSNDTAYYTLKSASGLFLPFPNNARDDRNWNLSLNPQIPTNLTVNTGVGEAFLELQSMQLTGLDVNAGAGKSTLTLPRHGSFEARINAGVGELNIEIPKGLAVRMDVNKGVGQVDVQGDYERDGSKYESPGYSKATDRADLKVDGGVGKITIRQLGD